MTPDSLPADELERVVRSLGEGPLAGPRASALERFKSRGFPTTRNEDWKYTDLAPVVDISNRWLEAPDTPAVDEHAIRAIQETIDAHWLVIANGVTLDGRSTLASAPGVEVAALDADTSALDFPLADFNLALLREGVKIRVSDRFDDDKPIGLLLFDATGASPVVSQARIDLELAPGATAAFIEYHGSSGEGAHYANVHVNMALDAAAEVRYLRLQERDLSHTMTARLNVSLAQGARFRHDGVDLGARMARNDLQVDLEGRDAHAEFNGLYIAGDGQHLDNHTRVDHRVGPAESRQEYRGILGGHSRAVWNGKAIVHAGADGTDAAQANHNLLLSDHAEIDAKPELEIYADEVKCAHGTTVGQLDDAALFYLQSRGIDRERAERIVTRAFAATIVGKSPIESLHEMLGERVERRLRQMTSGASS